MYALFLLLPFNAFLVSMAFGRMLGRKGSVIINIMIIMLTFMISLFIFYEVCYCQSTVIVNFYEWFVIDIYKVDFGLLIDPVSSLMVTIILLISFLVQMYSISYMSHDPYLPRFLGYLSLFTFCMLFLVTASNFVQMFIGWEGVGLCSYLLINFWFTRIAANKAALKAMITNRISDVFLMFGIVLILITFKTSNYLIVFNLIPFIVTKTYIMFNVTISLVSVVAFFLFVGAIGKSAQIGFHVWLPDAMEGPTPVSALLHAATMVTAGVFLVVRCSTIFIYSEIVQTLLIVFGSITALYAGFAAICQVDLKKIIAYSTCSQLGYMFFTLGLSNYSLALAHLWNHAFFKALLFLSAGIVIHIFSNEQDLRKMGGLKQLEPLLYLCFVIGNLAIMGFPFLTGFYSKDLIIEYAYSSSIVDGLFVYVISIISAIFTIIYSVKMLFYVFFSSCLSYRKSFEVYLNGRVGTVNRVELINIPVYVLTILSVIVGYIFHDALGGFGNMFWQESIYNLPQYFAPINCEFIAGTVKLLPFLLSIIFAKFTIFMIYCFEDCIDTEHYSRLAVYDKYAEPLARFCYINYINLIYMRFFNYIYNYSYINFYKFMDKGIFEYIFNILFPRLVLGYYKNNRLLLSKDNNNLFHNIFLYFILCIIVILVLSLMPKFYSVCQIYVGIIVLIIFIKNVKVKDKLKELIY